MGKKNDKFNEKEALDDVAQFVIAYEGLDLTPADMKALASKCLPAFAGMPIRHRCDIIGIAPKSYYRAMAKPEFRAACVKVVKEMLGGMVPEVWHSFCKGAVEGTLPSQIRILEETGVLTAGKNETTVHVNVSVIEQKREENMKKGLERLGFALTDN